MKSPVGRYEGFRTDISLFNREWPNRSLEKAPLYCSVDLRDGNQALVHPMGVKTKLEMFDLLVKCGFKHIEVGFPAASPTEFEFVRRLIEDGRIPSDVTIQVLVQAREDLIDRTVKSLVGVKKAIVHIYNSTSPVQRRVVFGLSKAGVIDLAVRGVSWIKDRLTVLRGSEIMLEYSPESFSATECRFSLQICQAVMDVWQPTCDNPIILNLPATVEVAPPNVYADQVEWFCRNVKQREVVIVSVHTHNDRGTAVAATEFALCAGADRVEGTLFGNGERTGNLCIVTLALNLHTQGIPCGLDFSELENIKEVYERCTGMTIPDRHPYAGGLVFTAFSGSHQDAIRKGMLARDKEYDLKWGVPYLPIDPQDIGRNYSEVIRVNSQSGKAGVAHLLSNEFGFDLSKGLLVEFGPIVTQEVDRLGTEVNAATLKKMFEKEYLEKDTPYSLKAFSSGEKKRGVYHCKAVLVRDEQWLEIEGEGKGIVDSFVNALKSENLSLAIEVSDYAEHSLGSGADANAIAYVCVRMVGSGKKRWGVGIDASVGLAPIKAIVSALNRM